MSVAAASMDGKALVPSVVSKAAVADDEGVEAVKDVPAVAVAVVAEDEALDATNEPDFLFGLTKSFRS